MLNGAPTAVSTTLDDAGDVLWVTLLSTLSGTNVIDIAAAGSCVAAPARAAHLRGGRRRWRWRL